MSTVELERAPSLGGLYRSALLGAVRRHSGDTLPDAELRLAGVPVDRARLAEYDRVCGFRLADTLPATYPHVLAFPLTMALMCRPDFPFPVLGLVHVANTISIYRPLTTDGRLDLTVRAENLRPHERGRQLDVVAVAAVDGTEVWREVSTYLRREGASTDRQREPAEPPHPTAIWRVDPSVGTEYAAVSGDRNPIHTSRLGARAFGFRRRIAHGMWSLARSLAQLDGRLPEAYTVEVQFKLPVLLPARVAFSARPAWEFALHDAASGKPHLTGAVRT
jgi:MaoC like domain